MLLQWMVASLSMNLVLPFPQAYLTYICLHYHSLLQGH